MRITPQTPIERIYRKARQLYRLRALTLLIFIPFFLFIGKRAGFTLENLGPISLVILIELFVNHPYKIFFKNSGPAAEVLMASVVIDFLAGISTLHLLGHVDFFLFTACFLITITYCALNLPVFLILQITTLASMVYAGLIVLGNLRSLPQTVFLGASLSRVQEAAVIVRHIAFFYLIAILVRSLASALSKKEARLVQLSGELRETSHKIKYAYYLQTEYFSHISHDIRAPLNSLLGFSQLLLESPTEPPTERQKDFLTRMERSSKHLRDLINDVLELSRIESKRMQLVTAEIDLVGVLWTAIDLFSEEAARKNLDLAFTEKPGHLRVTADELKLRQVFYNLLSNAVKFTPEGFIRILLTREPDGGARITIEDSGPGIPPEKQAFLFRPYEQGGHPASVGLKTSGLGLALSRKFVEMHGGRLWVESESGKGSRFILTLPPAPVLKVERISAEPSAASEG